VGCYRIAVTKPLFSRRGVLKLAGGAVGHAVLAPAQALAIGQPVLMRKIPRSGESLPAVGIGSSQTFDVTSEGDRAQVKEVMRVFSDLGGRVVDTSPMYGNAESVIGEVAAQLRIGNQLFLATKVWISGREAGIEQAQESMRRMRTKRLDLIQVHNLLDVETHLRWLSDWKKAGQVRYLGVTHYQAGAHSALEKYVASKQVDFVQVNYSIAERDAESSLLPAAISSGTAVIVNRPFAASDLFNRVRGHPLPEWSAEFDAASWAQFFLKYVLAHPAVTCVIPASRNPKHAADNMAAGRGRLPDEKMRRRMVDFVSSL